MIPGSGETFGALAQDVVNLKEGHSELRREFRILDGKMDSGFLGLAAKLDAKTTTNWQPIGIMLTTILALGGALYMPIREAAIKQETQVEMLRAITVPRVEHERLWREAIEREKRVDEAMRRLWETEVKNAVDIAFMRGQLSPVTPR